MVTDYEGTEIVPGDLVEAYEYGEPFPARIEHIQLICGMHELTLTRLDTGDGCLRYHDAVTKMSGA